jgi:hypothetical protein
MLEKKSPVRLLPLINGMLDGASHPMSPNPITFRSLRSQSRGNLIGDDDDAKKTSVRQTVSDDTGTQMRKQEQSRVLRHAGDPAVPLEVPRHQGVPRRHPATAREACVRTQIQHFSTNEINLKYM